MLLGNQENPVQGKSIFRLKDVKMKEFLNKTVTLTCIIKNVTYISKDTNKTDGYFKIALQDKGISLQVVMFNVTESDKESLVTGVVHQVDLKVNLHNNELSYIIKKPMIRREDLTTSDYLFVADKYEEHVKLITATGRSITNSVYRQLVSDILAKYWEKFICIPAGISQHHIELGGCAMHTATIIKNAEAVITTYKYLYGDGFIDRDLVMAAVILHDILKAEEFSVNTLTGEIAYTDSSVLASHILSGVAAIQEAAVKAGLESTEEVKLLKHCVASHHGKLEYGSPVQPAIPEAKIVNALDSLDADIWKFNYKYKGLESGESTSVYRNGSREAYYKK